MKLKRFFSAFLAAALLAGTVPAALAADIDSHWSKPYVTSLHELGIINPSASTGNYTPEASSRAGNSCATSTARLTSPKRHPSAFPMSKLGYVL